MSRCNCNEMPVGKTCKHCAECLGEVQVKELEQSLREQEFEERLKKLEKEIDDIKGDK